jgi:hypothetical protein
MSMSRRQSNVIGRSFFLAGIVVGGLLVAGSITWMALAKPSDVWSPQQAEEFNAAQGALHAAISGIDRGAGEGPQRSEDAVAVAQSRFDRINEELEHARSARYSWGWRGVIAGTLLAAVCGIGFRLLEKNAD